MTPTEAAPAASFPARLKAARRMRRLTQHDLAARSGLPAASVSHFEGGARLPSCLNLSRLADALDVSADYLLGRVDEPACARADDAFWDRVALLEDGDRELVAAFVGLLEARRA